MLRHSQDSTDTTSNAANYKSTSYSGLTPDSVIASPFTAEEIAEAIAEIESEKALRHSSQTSAAQIASVLDHLNLDMAPSEVAAKIEKQRRARVQTGKAQRRKRSLFVALAAGLSCMSIGGLVAGRLMMRTPAPMQEATTVAAPVQEVQEATAVATADGEKVAIATAETAQQKERRAMEEALRARLAVIEARAAEQRAEQDRARASRSQ